MIRNEKNRKLDWVKKPKFYLKMSKNEQLKCKNEQKRSSKSPLFWSKRVNYFTQI